MHICSGRSRIFHGGRGTHGGGMASRGGYILEILYVKTKESGPLGGPAPGTPPRSTNAFPTCSVLLLNYTPCNSP